MHHERHRPARAALSQIKARLKVAEPAHLHVVDDPPPVVKWGTPAVRFPAHAAAFARTADIVRQADTLLFMPAEELPYIETPPLVALSEQFESGSVEFNMGSSLTSHNDRPA
jgi:hypothetical protein